MFIFLQEHWLPHYQACEKISSDFPTYKFLTTSSDMFSSPEDLILQSGPTWHGTALGWSSSIDTNITKLAIVSDRFYGVRYLDIANNIDISVRANSRLCDSITSALHYHTDVILCITQT